MSSEQPCPCPVCGCEPTALYSYGAAKSRCHEVECFGMNHAIMVAMPTEREAIAAWNKAFRREP